MVFPFMAGSGQWWFFSGPMSDSDWAQIGAILINAAFFYLLLEIVRRAGPVFFSTQNYVATLAGIGWGILILAESHSVYVWGRLGAAFRRPLSGDPPWLRRSLVRHGPRRGFPAKARVRGPADGGTGSRLRAR